MMLDDLLKISDAQAITADAASTYSIDLGSPTVKRRIGTGEPLEFLMSVGVAADGTTTDETYEFQVVQSDNADLSSPDIIMLRTLTYAQLLIATLWHFPIPPGTPTKRYIGMYYNVGGNTPSVTVSAWLQPQNMVDARLEYATGSVML